jgi:NAD(P)H dehydrogenase (quinone)
MVIVPVVYAAPAVGRTQTGGSPYGPTHYSPQTGKDGLSDDEREIAVHYGGFFHDISARLAVAPHGSH